MSDIDEHEARLKGDVLRAVESFYVTIGTPRNADMARLTDEALDRLLDFVRARTAYQQLGEVRSYGDEEAVETLQYVDEELEARRSEMARLTEEPDGH